MDWDKLRIFHAAAAAGSFTHAGEALNMSQSAVSRQVSALEQSLNVTLFHRHARGLSLTEAGELLHRTAHEIQQKLDHASSQLEDNKDRPSGKLRVTTTVGLGSTWLVDRLLEFANLYPEIDTEILLTDVELDLSSREADVALRLRQPVQADLIQRRLFTVHMHAYASPRYLRRKEAPKSLAEFEGHRIISWGDNVPHYLRNLNWLEAELDEKRISYRSVLRVNNLVALKRAVQQGIGIAVLPDYIIGPNSGLMQISADFDVPGFDTYLTYAEEMRETKRVMAFRDFIIQKARDWTF